MKKLLILAIEDNKADMLLYQEFLTQFPEILCEFLEAGTATHAMMLLEQYDPDCIFLDYRLPDEDGITLLDNIKTKIANPPPIAFITGSGEVALKEKALENGVGIYLHKNELTPEALHEAVITLCET